MDFDKICKTQVTPLRPKEVLIEFLKYNPDIFKDIFKKREDIYKDILEIILSSRADESSLNSFIRWYREYLYDY